MNIFQTFQKAATNHPKTVALIERGRALTYERLLHQINAEASRYRQRGIRPGDRVLVFVPMSIDLYRTVLALFKIGATAVFLDEWVSTERLRLCCKLADCRALIGGWKVRLMAKWFPETRRIPIHLSPKAIARTESPTESVVAEHPALITFTTGSTGTPKAALRSHGFLRAQLAALQGEIEPRPEVVSMTTLPIVLLIQLAAGGTSVLPDFNPRRPDSLRPARIWDQVERFGVQQLIGSPHFVKTLAQEAPERTAGRIKEIVTGGAPVFPNDAAQLLRAFPQANIRIAYGSTEAEPISLIDAVELANAEAASHDYGVLVGQPNDALDLRIISITPDPLNADDTPLRDCAPGEVGEIVVAGPHVLRTYFNNEAGWRANKIPDGERLWHRTGDAGRLGADGQLYLVGRCAEIRVHDGVLHSPFLVENRLAQLPGVTMGTVVFDRDEPVVCVETAVRVGIERLKAELARLFPTIVRRVILERLPRDPRHHSKIDYGRLRSMLGGSAKL